MPSTILHHITITPGTPQDYAALQPFHYRPGHPGVITRIFAARYLNPNLPPAHPEHSLLAGILVESLPALACSLRNLALPHHFTCKNRPLGAAKLNRDLRTISRIIIHPIFRSAGLAIQLVQHLLAHAQTPYIEALAAMGRIHPFFKKAGMTEFDRPPLPAHIRLTAALAHENLQPLDLIDPQNLTPSPFLQKELQRFAHLPNTTPIEQLLAHARQHLLSQPLYYLWAAPTTVK